MWYYSTEAEGVKGPVPTMALVKLVEHGLPETSLVYQDTWLPLSTALQSELDMVRASYYCADGAATIGPLDVSELRRRFQDGDIDGLTNVFFRGQWRGLGDTPLKDLLSTNDDEYDQRDMTFEPQPKPDDDVWDDPAKVDEQWDSKDEPPKRKKKKKKGFSKAQTWVYVTGLPSDVTVAELEEHFRKVGVIAVDADMLPKIKIYAHDGVPKGDAAVCYAHAASVDLALQILDGGSLRYGVPITVQKGDFSEKRLGEFDASKTHKSNAKKAKVAKLANDQKMRWDRDEDAGGTDTTDALRIIVVQGLFDPATFDSDTVDAFIIRALDQLQTDKVTVFQNHPLGVAVLKMKSPTDAQLAISQFNALAAPDGRQLRSTFWDGVSDYSSPAVDDDEEARIDNFGSWLESQDDDLPPELQLQVEGS